MSKIYFALEESGRTYVRPEMRYILKVKTVIGTESLTERNKLESGRFRQSWKTTVKSGKAGLRRERQGSGKRE